jgi:hypothetical protein
MTFINIKIFLKLYDINLTILFQTPNIIKLSTSQFFYKLIIKLT